MNRFNSALVSNTLICESSRLLIDSESDITKNYFHRNHNSHRRLFDLISLIEAVILNEQLYTLPTSSDLSKEKLSLRHRLIEEGILIELDTSAYHNELSKLIIEYLRKVEKPVKVGGSAAVIGTEISFEKIEGLVKSFFEGKREEKDDQYYDFGPKPTLNDSFELHHHGSPSEIVHLDSFDGMVKSLIGWIEYYGSGSYQHCTSILRDIYYVLVGEFLGIPYYPQSTRLEFSRKFPNYFDKNFSTRLYKTVAKSFSTTVAEVYEFSSQSVNYIPPFSTILFNQTKHKDGIIDSLIKLRNDYVDLRRNLTDFQVQKEQARDFKMLKRISTREKELLEKVAAPFKTDSKLRLEKAIKYIPDLVKPATDPMNPTKYSSNLILQPAEWIRDWWIKRPVRKLVQVSNKLNKVPDYRALISKFFPELDSDINWEQFLKYNEL